MESERDPRGGSRDRRVVEGDPQWGATDSPALAGLKGFANFSGEGVGALICREGISQILDWRNFRRRVVWCRSGIFRR
jgi:hypothetical protein